MDVDAQFVLPPDPATAPPADSLAAIPTAPDDSIRCPKGQVSPDNWYYTVRIGHFVGARPVPRCYHLFLLFAFQIVLLHPVFTVLLVLYDCVKSLLSINTIVTP